MRGLDEKLLNILWFINNMEKCVTLIHKIYLHFISKTLFEMFRLNNLFEFFGTYSCNILYCTFILTHILSCPELCYNQKFRANFYLSQKNFFLLGKMFDIFTNIPIFYRIKCKQFWYKIRRRKKWERSWNKWEKKFNTI